MNSTRAREEGVRRAMATERLSLKAFGKQWMEYRRRNNVDIPRQYILFFETHERGTVVINSSRLQGFDATNPWDVTRAEIEGRRQCYQIYRFLKDEAIGFENSVLLSTPYHVGVRDSRRIKGAYTLTADDVINQVKFDDTIAQGAYPIDVHSPDKEATDSIHLAPDHTYFIPLRSLYAPEVSNLVVAGRCISADHNAFSAIRVTPIAMSIGQAAGAAAALAAAGDTTIGAVDPKAGAAGAAGTGRASETLTVRSGGRPVTAFFLTTEEPNERTSILIVQPTSRQNNNDKPFEAPVGDVFYFHDGNGLGRAAEPEPPERSDRPARPCRR